MTKIKLDIDSDKEIIQANVVIKYAEGTTINKEIVNAEVPSTTKKSSTSKKTGVDESFLRSY